MRKLETHIVNKYSLESCLDWATRKLDCWVARVGCQSRSRNLDFWSRETPRILGRCWVGWDSKLDKRVPFQDVWMLRSIGHKIQKIQNFFWKGIENSSLNLTWRICIVEFKGNFPPSEMFYIFHAWFNTKWNVLMPRTNPLTNFPRNCFWS